MSLNPAATRGRYYCPSCRRLAALRDVLRVSQVDDVKNRVVFRRDVLSEVRVETLEIRKQICRSRDKHRDITGLGNRVQFSSSMSTATSLPRT